MAEISLAVKTETAEELQESVLNLATIMGGQKTVKANASDPHVEPEPESKQEKKKVTKAKKEQTEAKPASTEKTSEEKVSSTKNEETKKETKTIDDEPEKSITEGQHPNATKSDVQVVMKKAMDSGHRPEIKTAFGRFNAGKLSDLKEEDYSAFITDLEALIATVGE